MNIFVSQHPEHLIRQQQAVLLAGTEDNAAFALAFSFEQYYLPVPQAIELVALIYLTKTETRPIIFAAIFTSNSQLVTAIESLTGTASAMQAFARQHGVPWLELSAPLRLDPVKIAKPWGQEIWYTGIEARGQSNVMAQGFLTPLPWVLALMPDYLAAGKSEKIILLKTLDPLPDEVYGDLYFELHERKQEVYLVTHIDSQAWPHNTGAIRLGFDRDRLAQFGDQQAFKAAYLTAVKDYEKVRHQIDTLLDTERDSRGIAPDAAIDVTSRSSLMLAVPEELRLLEQQSRTYMNSFSAVLPLRLGDVVKVPCYVPHALQHGVRTIEWQTPVYERKILSFAQKVLTQSHWDTAAALEGIQLVAPEQEALRVISNEAGVLIEEVVKFDDFQVIRITLAAAQDYRLKVQDSYGLLMPVGGGCTLISEENRLDIAAEAAVFIPQQLLASACHKLRLSAGDAPVQILLAGVVV